MTGTSEVTASEEGVPGDFQAALRSFEGRPSGPPVPAPDAVGEAMIRHYAHAVGDENPIYTDDAAARATGRAGIVAPPAMLQVWTMPTLRQKLASLAGGRLGATTAGTAQDELIALLEQRGFTSIVATDCEQDYLRELVVGDRLSLRSTIETVSPEKRTALGAGHFVTTQTEFCDVGGQVVGRMMFRILLYRPAPPGLGSAAVAASSVGVAGARPRPIITSDNAFFFEGLRAGEIRIQRCAGCGELRHPPRPRCATCGSYDHDYVVAAGNGTLHSYVVVHHPQMPGFGYPLPIGLVDLEEGVRMVAELAGVDPATLSIGSPLVGEAVAVDEGLSVPRFRPPQPQLTPGTQLPSVVVRVTRTAIVAGALASRDFQDVHHDHELAHAKGAPDIFMNILTTNGYVGRLVTDWAGPAAVVERIAIRLGAPNYPGDTMVLSGEVADVETTEAGTTAEVDVRGANRLGEHVTGKVRIRIPAGLAGLAS